MRESFFRLKGNGTTARREAVAGLTTFAAMAYILTVNPAILSVTGMDRGALITATALAAALTTASMAFVTNYPVALAPGMDLNAFFAFTMCGALRLPWRGALGLVFWEGVVFLLLTLSGVRVQRCTDARLWPWAAGNARRVYLGGVVPGALLLPAGVKTFL